ncbi:hypothetical protein WCE55_05055 [Luteimonas sp. MJ293]|uniref:hypothetical protein n=1 Tax=Luteimonas sp. MJ146 TaxID=3129240 RepID=UPI0031BACA21
MRRALLLLVALVPAIAMAGFPFEATLEEMAQQADHILVGRVAGVDMVDGQGRPVKDPEARTGPSLDNTIRLLIQVDQVLVSNAAKVPDVIPVPLASHLHYKLGQIQEAHERDEEVRLVLLKGSDFVGIKPGVFLRPLTDKDTALRLHAASHP